MELDKCGTRARTRGGSVSLSRIFDIDSESGQPTERACGLVEEEEGVISSWELRQLVYIFPLPHGSIKAILRNAIRRDITLEMEQRALSAALTWAAKCVRLKSNFLLACLILSLRARG